MLDFNNLLSSHFGITDEAFHSKMSFERTVGFIKYLADELKLPLDEHLLVIELNEGVFIRTQTAEWCEELTKQSKENKIEIEAIGITKWNELSRNYRAPINSFGDERLVRWKVGFF